MIKLTFREELANWITGGEFMVLKIMACLEGGLMNMVMVDRDTKLAALTSRIAELESQAKSISNLVNIVNDPKQSDTIAALRAKLATVEDEREAWHLLVDDLSERLASAEAQVKDVEAGQEIYGEDDWQAMKNIAYRAGYYQAECGLPIDDKLPELNLKLCGKVLKAQRRVSNLPHVTEEKIPCLFCGKRVNSRCGDWQTADQCGLFATPKEGYPEPKRDSQ
jgi:hypothetical protein